MNDTLRRKLQWKFSNIWNTHDYEQLVICQDKTSGLKAIIAIHDTTLGPALGGTRMWTYASEEEAIEDALRLARGMTYKNAAAGLKSWWRKNSYYRGSTKQTKTLKCSVLSDVIFKV